MNFRRMGMGFDPEDAEFEAQYGDLLDHVTDLLMEEEKKPGLLNAKQMGKVSKIHAMMEAEVKSGCNAKLSYELNTPFKSMGSVHLEGNHIVFKHPKEFVDALKLASNVEVYPKTNGTVHLAYTVHGLTTPIG